MSIALPAARRLRADTIDLTGTFPVTLDNLLALIDDVKAVPAPSDPAAGLVDAAIAGKSQDLKKLVADAARAESEASYWQRLRGSVEKVATRRFQRELRDGAADAIIASLRPRFDETAQRIRELRDVVDISWTPEQLVAEGTPEQLSAYKALPPLVAQIDRIVALVAGFGRHGSYPVLDEPGGLVSNEVAGLRDEALFATSADVWQASQVIRARLADWRSSPWLRIPLQLNSVDDARERLRAASEAAWDAIEASRGQRGRMTTDGWVQDPKRPNPFSLPGSSTPESAAPVDVEQPDPTEVVDPTVLDLAAIVGAPEHDDVETH
jgi:hypothetical protein